MKTDSKQGRLKRGKKSKISFDKEVISKDQAAKLLSEQGETSIISKNQIEKNEGLITRKNKKRKALEDVQTTGKLKSKKKQSDNPPIESKINIEEDINKTEHTELANKPKKESNRAQKRKKHAEQLEQKKLKVDLELQQKALNYLSKWKHSRSEWKFEKLKQVWIQQNLFDTSKIPDEFWETTLQYFIGAKGHTRQVALDEAIKIIEKEEETSEENMDEDYKVKLNRARTIVQNLQ